MTARRASLIATDDENRAEPAAGDPLGSSREAHNYPSPNAALTRTRAAANLCPKPSLPPRALPSLPKGGVTIHALLLVYIIS